jgi:hypothetical protein
LKSHFFPLWVPARAPFCVLPPGWWCECVARAYLVRGLGVLAQQARGGGRGSRWWRFSPRHPRRFVAGLLRDPAGDDRTAERPRSNRLAGLALHRRDVRRRAVGGRGGGWVGNKKKTTVFSSKPGNRARGAGLSLEQEDCPRNAYLRPICTKNLTVADPCALPTRPLQHHADPERNRRAVTARSQDSVHGLLVAGPTGLRTSRNVATVEQPPFSQPTYLVRVLARLRGVRGHLRTQRLPTSTTRSWNARKRTRDAARSVAPDGRESTKTDARDRLPRSRP